MNTQNQSQKSPLPLGTPPSESGKSKLLMISGAVVLLAILAAGAYFGFSRVTPQADDNTPPPSLAIKGGAKGSFVEQEMSLLKFEPSDSILFDVKQEEFKKQNIAATKLKPGVNYVYAEKEISFDDVVSAVDPLAGRMAVTYYDPSVKKFLIYPAGPFDGTQEVKAADIKTTKIPAGSGFVVMVEKEANLYGSKFGTDKATISPTFLADDKTGWQLVAANDTLAKTLAPLSAKGRIVSAWAQKSDTEFEKVSDINGYTLGKYLVWVNIRTPQALPSPTVTGVTPNSAAPGSSTLVTITGTNLLNTDLSFSDTELSLDTATGVAAPTFAADKITLTVKVAPTAKEETKKIFIYTKDGKSKAEATFTVVKSGTTVTTATSVTPTGATQGDKEVSVKITGTNLKDSTVAMEGATSGITIKSLTVATDGNSIDMKIEVSETAPTPANFIIKPKSGADIKLAFAVSAKGATTATAITPTSLTQGDVDKDVTITGTNLKDATVTAENAKITIASAKVTDDGKSVAFKASIALDAQTGATNIIVTPKSGTAATAIKLAFTINAKSAPVTNVAPEKPSAITFKQNEKNVDDVTKIDPTKYDIKVIWTPGADDTIMQSADAPIGSDKVGAKKEMNYRLVVTNTADSKVVWEVPWEIADSNNACAVQLYRDGAQSAKKSWICQDAAIPKTTLAPDKSYVLTIEASDGNMKSGEVSMKFATISSPPGDITEEPKTLWNGTDKVTIYWNTPKDDGGSPITDYEVTINKPDKTTIIKVAGSPKTNMDIFSDDTPNAQNPLKNGDTYTFTVKAKNANGLSKNSSPVSKSVTPKGAILLGEGCNPPIPGENNKIASMISAEPYYYKDPKTGKEYNFKEQPAFAFASSWSIQQDPKINITGPKKVNNVQLVKVSEGTFLFCMSRFVLPSDIKKDLPVGKYKATISNLGPNVDPPDDEDQKTADFAIAKDILVAVDNYEWVKGTINTENANGKYNVKKTDGTEMKDIEKSKIALFDQHPIVVKKDQKVIVYSDNTSAYWSAMVTQVNAEDGTADIRYDDKSGGEDGQGNVAGVSIEKKIWISAAGEVIISKEEQIAEAIVKDFKNIQVSYVPNVGWNKNTGDLNRRFIIKKDSLNNSTYGNNADIDEKIFVSARLDDPIFKKEMDEKTLALKPTQETAKNLNGFQSNQANTLHQLSVYNNGSGTCLFWTGFQSSNQCNGTTDVQLQLNKSSYDNTLGSYQISKDELIIPYADKTTHTVYFTFKYIGSDGGAKDIVTIPVKLQQGKPHFSIEPIWSNSYDKEQQVGFGYIYCNAGCENQHWTSPQGNDSLATASQKIILHNKVSDSEANGIVPTAESEKYIIQLDGNYLAAWGSQPGEKNAETISATDPLLKISGKDVYKYIYKYGGYDQKVEVPVPLPAPGESITLYVPTKDMTKSVTLKNGLTPTGYGKVNHLSIYEKTKGEGSPLSEFPK